MAQSGSREAVPDDSIRIKDWSMSPLKNLEKEWSKRTLIFVWKTCWMAIQHQCLGFFFFFLSVRSGEYDYLSQNQNCDPCLCSPRIRVLRGALVHLEAEGKAECDCDIPFNAYLFYKQIILVLWVLNWPFLWFLNTFKISFDS